MKTIEEIQKRVTEIVVDVHDTVPTTLERTFDALTADGLDFKQLVKNKVAIERIRDLNDSLVDDDDDFELKKLIANTGQRCLALRENFMSLGATPDLDKEEKILLVKMVEVLRKYADELNGYYGLVNNGFHEWVTAHCDMSDPDSMVTFAQLRDHYVETVERGTTDIPNKKKFAQLLKIAGAVPFVTSVDGKTTRVYKGIKWRTQK